MSDSSATADPMEAEIRLAVKHSIKQSLGLPLASWSEAYLVEAVLVDVTAAGNPASPEDAISRSASLHCFWPTQLCNQAASAAISRPTCLKYASGLRHNHG